MSLKIKLLKLLPHLSGVKKTIITATHMKHLFPTWAVLSQPSLQWTRTDVLLLSTLSAIRSAPDRICWNEWYNFDNFAANNSFAYLLIPIFQWMDWLFYIVFKSANKSNRCGCIKKIDPLNNVYTFRMRNCIFDANYAMSANTMSADTLVPCITRPSAVLKFTVQNSTTVIVSFLS